MGSLLDTLSGQIAQPGGRTAGVVNWYQSVPQPVQLLFIRFPFFPFFFSFFVLSMHQVDGTGAASGLPNSEVKTPACLSGGPPLAAAPRPTPSAALSRIFAAAFTLEKSESTPAREISSMMLQIPRGQKATIRRWAAVQPRLPGRPRPLETANIMPWGAFYFPYRSISV